jgi:hypothetical protein
MKSLPRISFGMIVLNGEPFTLYNLRALYPFAYQIIVVEGATLGAVANANPDGHSTDSTLKTLRRFKAGEDPENKLTLITREGFWPEKDEMSQAYAQAATGDYLWQVDSDEFYLPRDIEAVLALLQNNPSITAMSFQQITFWGAPDYTADSWILRRGAAEYHRLFKWGKGYTYATHRPPTVLDEHGRNLRDIHFERSKIKLYHYSLLFPRQVTEKSEYYASAAWSRRTGSQNWAENAFLKLKYPFRVHNLFQYPSWLERFQGDHPPQVLAMWEATPDSEKRPTADIEALLNSRSYRLLRPIVKLLDYPSRPFAWLKPRLKALAPAPLKQALKKLRS